jgi:hypothetical protein
VGPWPEPWTGSSWATETIFRLAGSDGTAAIRSFTSTIFWFAGHSDGRVALASGSIAQDE